MSPSRRKALEYFAKSPAGTKWLDALSPSKPMIRRMIEDGELELIPPPGNVGMMTYRLTMKGWGALSR